MSLELMRAYCVSTGTGSRTHLSLDKLQKIDWLMVDLYTAVANQTSTPRAIASHLRVPRCQRRHA
jgi:hypothetical protein